MARRARLDISKPKKYTAKELADLRRYFATIDQDGDGRVSRAEVIQFAKVNGIDPRFVKLAFLLFDSDKNGGLQFEEYLDFLTIAGNFEKDKRSFYRRVFEALDKDKNGVIDGAEFQVLCEAFDYTLTLKEATEVVKSMDHTGTGNLVFDDLCHWLGLPRLG
jgi:Ca2+-binding EF-hand superfamily protein